MVTAFKAFFLTLFKLDLNTLSKKCIYLKKKIKNKITETENRRQLTTIKKNSPT